MSTAIRTSSSTKRRNQESLTNKLSEKVLNVIHNDESFNEEQSIEAFQEATKITNYQEEMILSIYYSLLEIIIDEYVVIQTEPIEDAEEAEEFLEEEMIVKDFYNLKSSELKDVNVLYVNDSKVTMSKQSIKHPSSMKGIRFGNFAFQFFF